MSNQLPIMFGDIEAAADRIRGQAVRTPLLENDRLNDITGGRVFIKPECLQRTGSFKFRGAYNRLAQLDERERAAGVVAFSSGNHAQGVACAAHLLGIPATIVMPADAPRIKMENTKEWGAEVVTFDRYNESREDIARRLCSERDATLVPSFEDVHIMAGQGTMGLEISNDLNDLGVVPDVALINCGGGGLSSGSTVALRHHFADIAIHTVEPDGYDDTARSLVSGKRESADISRPSICDALLSDKVGALPFAILRHHGVNGLVVSEDEARHAIRFAARELKLVGEPGGVVSLAAVLSGKIDIRGKIAVVVISGGNIDPAILAEIMIG